MLSALQHLSDTCRMATLIVSFHDCVQKRHVRTDVRIVQRINNSCYHQLELTDQHFDHGGFHVSIVSGENFPSFSFKFVKLSNFFQIPFPNPFEEIWVQCHFFYCISHLAKY